MNPMGLLQKYYDPQSELYRLLIIHSVLVTAKALQLARDYLDEHPKAAIDTAFLEEAAMLHDIGIYRCDSPAIMCTGAEPYVRHGVLGREILEQEGLQRHALVCERHTGAGITRDDVVQQALPLPERDYMPVSLEEKIICLADKFYSKKPKKLFKEKSLEKIRKNLEKYGAQMAERFDTLCTEIIR